MKSPLKILTPLALSLALGAFVVPEVSFAQGTDAVETSERPNRRARRGNRSRGDGAERAEGTHARRGHHGHRGHHLMRELDLSDNQKAQIRAIRQSNREEMRALRGAERTDASRAALRRLHGESRRLVREVLTPTQRTQLETLRTARHAERLAHRVERMTEHLSLTPAQVLRVTSILEQSQTDRAQARRNGDSRAAMQVVRERTRSAVENVLTDEQKAIRTAHRSERGERGRHGRRGRGQGRRGGPSAQ
ncbi:MAG: Spy/CpxP family protein refolding chaperone [Polyangiales bacterium]|jgi:Spy/CpxP family protein refolding chaperone